MLEQELQLEKSLFFILNGSDSVFLDNFMYLYSYKFTWIPFYLCFLLVFIYRKKWKEIVLVLLTVSLVILLCDQISSGFFKPYFHRFRPTHHPDFRDEVDIVFGYRGGRYGFISSHAANAFGFATLTALLFRNRVFTIMIFIFAFLNAYSRVYLGVHFISDVVVGALIGALAGLASYQLYVLGKKKFLKIDKRNLQKSGYSLQQGYLLTAVYCLIIAILLIFNKQLVSMLI